MRYAFVLAALAASLFAPARSSAAPRLIPPAKGPIGRNLEAFASIKLSEPAPEGGLEITVTSNDPSRLLLAQLPEQAGAKSITLKVNHEYAESPDFYIQAVGGLGDATFTASAPGYEMATGAVTIAPSAILISGPFQSTAFRTTTRSSATIALRSVLLDEKGKQVQEQPLAGGLSIPIEITSSDPKAGSIAGTPITLKGGGTIVAAEFRPAGVGETILAVKPGSGFTKPAEFASVTVTVQQPGIAVMGDINLGKDLQVEAYVILADPAPKGGVDVVLTSSDPKMLVVSTTDAKLGTGCITLHVPEGETKAPYYLQGLADSGTVTYTAVAKGYRSPTAPVTLAPSGFMVVYMPYGAPDEANFVRKQLVDNPRPFSVSLAENKKYHLAFWSAYLDPKTRRGADITAQKLRPGIEAKLEVSNSDPKVAKVASSVTMSYKGEYLNSEFLPLQPGETIISINTPPGFTTPSNATKVTASVTP